MSNPNYPELINPGILPSPATNRQLRTPGQDFLKSRLALYMGGTAVAAVPTILIVSYLI